MQHFIQIMIVQGIFFKIRTVALTVAIVVGLLAPAALKADQFEVRALHIDMRTEVMTMPALKQLALKASRNGINALVMEWEASFPFKENAVLCNKDAFTEDEVKDFVSFCSSLGVDVIPLQNCFGHCEYILRHPRYNFIREDRKEISQVCPSKEEECVKVFSSIFAEVAALHPSKYFHIGADETYLLGKCKLCSEKVEKEGKSKLFVDYICAMCKIVSDLGKIPVIWGDILLNYPECVDLLPKDIIVIDWNYGWRPDLFGDLEKISSAGITMWGAPALRSNPDNIYLTDWTKHFNNITTFIPFIREKGYKGVVETSWSTSGIYGLILDEGNELIDMQAIREVYPLAGFDILQKAYFKSLTQSEPLDWEAFVRDYGREHFGITDEDTFLSYFKLPQKPVDNYPMSPDRIEEDLQACLALRESFGSLKLETNRRDFDHLKLMLDIRINYLQFKKCESFFESDVYDSSSSARVKDILKGLIRDAGRLQKRFTALNKDYIKDTSVALGEWSYVGKMKRIYSAIK